ncbi:MAG: hypothetical protein JWN30_824 [Bacilli bacterium]|nr:hypothetical protein [Bacilli bacterium]
MRARVKWIQKIGLLFTVGLLVSLSIYREAPAAIAADQSVDPAPTSESGVLVDLQTGQLLWSKNPHLHEYPASITKIITAELALEHSALTDQVITPKQATEVEGNRVYLLSGESVTMKQMLYGLLIDSGNDAAVAIADHISGTVSSFADLMNEKAKSLGATDTHFVTPNGLHDPNHYSSAYDMALIARDAMKNAEFRTIVSTKTYSWHSQGWDAELDNLNQMLWTYDGATGIKTGFTDQAEQTIVVSATRNGRQLLAVLMHSSTQNLIHQDAARVLDYGFNQFKTVTVNQSGDVIIEQGRPVTISTTLAYDVPLSDTDAMRTTINYTPPTPPYGKGSRVGTITLWHHQTAVIQSDLLAADDVKRVENTATAAATASPYFWLKNALTLIFTVAVLLLILRITRVKRTASYEKRQGGF